MKLDNTMKMLSERLSRLKSRAGLPETPRVPGSAQPDAAQGNVAANRPVESGITGERWIMILLAALLVLVIAGFLLYFLVLSPRKKRRPMLEAFEIINNDDKSRFEAAESLLARALTAGLKAEDVRQTQFALAYVRARAGNYREALAVADELCNSAASDREANYLRFWLLAKVEEDGKIEKTFNEKAKLLGGLLDTKIIAGITFLRLAKSHWAKHSVDQAIRYFEMLRRLGVLKDQIPSQIDEYRVIFGTMALFEKNLAAAEQHFTESKKLAKQGGKSTISSEMGLLLCRWKREDLPDIDDDLSGIVARLESQNGGDDTAGIQDEKGLLRRNVFLWHSVSLIFRWLRFPALSVEKITPDQWKDLRARLDRVRKEAPEMGDPDLIWGLLRYYFFFDEEDEREQATKVLNQARDDKGINVPEVVSLIDREKRLAKLYDQSLVHYLGIVREWLESSDVPQELRVELMKKLQTYKRFQELGDINMAADEDYAPSLVDIQFRVSSLSRRVNNIVKPHLRKNASGGGDEVDRVMGELRNVSETLSQNTEKLEKTEQEMMLITGEFLLAEEGDAEPLSETDGS